MRYAVIENGVCVNIVKSDAAFAKSMGWVLLPDGFGIGDRYEAGAFFRTYPEPEEEK